MWEKQPHLSISLAIFHRGALSLGAANKDRLGQAIFHWAILVNPFHPFHVSSKPGTIFDATDGIRQDPITLLDTNPNHEWYFRVREVVDPLTTANVLGAVAIGEIRPRHGLSPGNLAGERIRRILEQVPLPRKDQVPEENCVSWAKEAVLTLQREGLLEERPGGVEGIEAIWEVGMTLGEGIIREGAPNSGGREARVVRLFTRTIKYEGTVLGRINRFLQTSHGRR